MEAQSMDFFSSFSRFTGVFHLDREESKFKFDLTGAVSHVETDSKNTEVKNTNS